MRREMIAKLAVFSRIYLSGQEAHLPGLSGMALKNGVFSAFGHFKQKLFEALFRFRSEQRGTQDPAMGFLNRDAFFSCLLFESFNYLIVEVSDQQLRHFKQNDVNDSGARQVSGEGDS
jgi:hypothetical protein